MARRADIKVATGLNAAHFSGAGTNYVVQTPSGVFYMVFADNNQVTVFTKSSDGGLTWSSPTVVASTPCTNLAVWYDRWSNIAAGLIHVAYTESTGSDTRYRTINTESSDALSTDTVIFAGTSRAAGGHLSITRAVGGNVYAKTCIDAGVEGGFYRLANANVPSGAWDAARTVDEALATLDQILLLPDFDAADTQDIMALFQDASVTELSRKLYDNSANSWAETSISASITELSTATAFRNFDAAPDITNTQHVVVAWNATDAANQDLLCWTVDATTITAKTDVVANATDDCGLAAVSIDTVTGYWYVFWGGNPDGSDTWNTVMNIYYKVSKDSGTTWGTATKLNTGTNLGTGGTLLMLYTCPRLLVGPFVCAIFRDGAAQRDLLLSVDHSMPTAAYVAGVF